MLYPARCISQSSMHPTGGVGCIEARPKCTIEPDQAASRAERCIADVLAFSGITEPRFVIAEGLALGDEARSAAREAALGTVRGIGAACPVLCEGHFLQAAAALVFRRWLASSSMPLRMLSAPARKFTLFG
ncbi:MAG: hypothetical protein ACTHKM_05885 [Tsuneonella sp.]